MAKVPHNIISLLSVAITNCWLL